MNQDDTTPILIGAGQFTQRNVELGEAKEPVDMMAECARRAAADAGGTERLLQRIDSVSVVNIVSWQYRNPPRLLAQRIGAHPSEEIYTTMGGNTPQWLVNETAARIASGTVRLALIAGVEAVHTLRRASKAGVKLGWTRDDAPPPAVVGDPRPGSSEHEMAHQMQMPINVFPLFENALRAHHGLSLAAHREYLGALCSRMSAVAAQNPHAWFPQLRSATEITTVAPSNRMISFPYPKYMNAIIDVDQAAALLMTSVGEARALGIDRSRWVYLRGTGDAHDLWFVSERVNYHTSPAIRCAGERALAMAGMSVGDIDYFDLYSCFPCAVQLGADMLGIPRNDARPLTVTGGLPYHGGPGSNYPTHAIATMMDRLRAQPGSKGLVSGLGWYVTKHSIGIYSTAPGGRPWQREDPQRYQPALDEMDHPELATQANGAGTIETYTVAHDREGAPVTGLIVGRLDDGRRFLANTPSDRSLLESLMQNEAIGRRGRVTATDAVNRFELS
jgi:acetyl-CoA C-acetyltransferase